jgi:hypothetical protein
MAGNKKASGEPPQPQEAPGEPPQPQEVPVPQPRRRWTGAGLAVSCAPPGITGGLIALDQLDLSPFITIAIVVVYPIVSWYLWLRWYHAQALIERQTMIEEELATTFNQVALEEARRAPVQGHRQVTIVERPGVGSYRLTRLTTDVRTKPSPSKNAAGNGAPSAPRANGHAVGRGPDHVRGRR